MRSAHTSATASTIGPAAIFGSSLAACSKVGSSRPSNAAVTIDNADDAAFESFTKLAGKGGFGVEYALPNSNLGLFAQAASYVYQFDRNGFDKTQADVLYTAGLSYRLAY